MTSNNFKDLDTDLRQIQEINGSVLNNIRADISTNTNDISTLDTTITQLSDATLRQDGSKPLTADWDLGDFSLENVNIITTSRLFIYDDSNPLIRLAEGGSSTSYTQIDDISRERTIIRKVVESGARAFIDINPMPQDGTSISSVRFFRETNTSGSRRVEFLQGDSSPTVRAQIGVGGTSTFFGLDGLVGVGINPPLNRLHVYSNTNGQVARFQNDGDNANREGIVIQCGADAGTGTTRYIIGEDGDGDTVGTIENNSGTFQLTSVSDPVLKMDMEPTKIDGLDVLNNIELIQYRFKKHGPDGKLHRIGFRADNCLKAFPEMVSDLPEQPLRTIYAALIPVLVKANQEMSNKIEELNSRILELEKRGNSPISIPPNQ